MKRRSVRCKLRTTMSAAVLTVALLPLSAASFWFWSPQQIRLRGLRGAYLAKAEHHAGLEREFARLSEYQGKSHMIASRGGKRVHIPIGQRPDLVLKYRELTEYHGALRDKYEHAAWHPSLPVEPDPPPPEL
jgi:hypothetical protein